MAHKMTKTGNGKHEVIYTLRDDNNETRNMTNEKRIMLERITLMAAEIIQPAGDTINQYLIGKRAYFCREPEQIDTFQGWKKRGYHVKRGEHAITELKLWNGCWRPYKFFAASQVAAN